MGKSSEEVTARKKELMLLALEANFGNVWKAAKMIKIANSTHYRWMKEDRDYASKAEVLKDIGYRDLRDDLLDKAMKQVEKGNVQVLNKMLGIFCKDLPEEMKMLRLNNDIPLRATVKFINTPIDPRRNLEQERREWEKMLEKDRERDRARERWEKAGAGGG
jgi:hypothetical protein